MLYLKPISKIKLYLQVQDGEFAGLTESVVEGGEFIELKTLTGLQAARASSVYRKGEFDYDAVYGLLADLTGSDQSQLDPSMALAILLKVAELSRPTEEQAGK